MSKVYDDWERLVRAVLKREELRQIALCPSFSSSSSFSSDFHFDPSSQHVSAANSATGATRGGVVARLFAAPAIALDWYRRRKPEKYFFDGPEVHLEQFSLRKLKVASDNFSNKNIPASAAGQMLSQPNLRVFSFSELKAATRNFRSDTLLGEGVFGKVYKGWLMGTNGERTVIAVKKFNSNQGIQEWQSEINFLGRLSHPNLVKLLGYCRKGVELLLVYEFMAKGCLENHLFGRGSAVQPLPWDVRLKIMIGAARGLAFLHASDRKVIYRDFKPSNILLDGSYHAKLSDFGIATMGPTASESHVTTTQVMGTYGYAAPEYVATGHLYVKSDVYGFGVVLAEMLTGLRTLDRNRPNGKEKLVEWIKPHLTDRRKLKNVMDSRLEGKYPSRCALQIAELSLVCLENEPKNRPSTQEIVETLERIDGATT